MRALRRIGAAAVLGTAVATVLAGPALAAPTHPQGRGWPFGQHGAAAVFVQTDNPAGNQVVAYRRERDGTLTDGDGYSTGGLGGILTGSVVDHLASQGSLQFDRNRGLLVAVNAGSNTVSVFDVSGDHLRLRQVVSSGGTFPVSVAIHHDLVYVLNAEDGGSVQGYRIASGDLVPLAGSNRSLGLDPTATPQFVNTPGQVAFTPDGSQLIITTKANGSDIDVFGVQPGGGLSASPVVNAEPGTVPFAITFDPAGNLVIAEAGTNALATFALSSAGTVTLLHAVPTGQAATCWVTAIGSLLFASNSGSNSVSRYSAGPDGALSLQGATSTDAGTVDSAATPGGRFLYVQTGGSGIVDEFTVDPGGSLTQLGSVLVPGAAGGEGITVG